MENLNLEPNEYYVINNTKRVLYWTGEVWMKPVKDAQKRFGAYIESLDKQPKVKSAVNVEQTEFINLFKPM